MAVQQDYAATGWLQALMGAQDPSLQQTRIFAKKHLDWIDSLSSLTTIREKKDTINESLEGIWDYTASNQLTWLIQNVPAAQEDWILPDQGEFTIHCKQKPDLSNAASLGRALGIQDWSTSVTMKILRADFSTWQQRVARVGSTAPVGFTMATSNTNMMEMPTTAMWTANQWADGFWTFTIDGQPQMFSKVEEAIQVARPDLDSLLDSALSSMKHADASLRANKAEANAFATTIPGWIPTGDPLVSLHESVYGGKNGFQASRSFLTAWESLWPVLYCRRKKLARGHCEMKIIRAQLDQCLSTDPKLSTWILVFGELLCQTFLGDGLGISAKYATKSTR